MCASKSIYDDNTRSAQFQLRELESVFDVEKKKIKLFCQPSCLKVGSERGNKILLVYRSVSSSSSVTSVIAELILTVFPRTIAGN